MATRRTEHRQVLTAEDRTRQAFDSVKRNFGGLEQQATRLRSVFVALGGALVVGGLLRMVKSAAETADEMGKMAQRTGIAVESLSQLKFAAEQNDVPLENLNTGLRTLAVNMLTAAQGSKQQAEAFALAGIEIQDAEGRLRATDKVLRDVAEAFTQMEDGTTKAALAQRFFGRSGAQMIPLLNQGADGIRELTEEADRLGLTITDKTAAAAEKFNDDLHALESALQGLVLSFSGPLIEDLVKITNLFRNAAGEASGLRTAAEALGNVIKASAAAYAIFGNQLMVVANSIEALFRAADLALGGEFGKAADVLAARPREILAEYEALWQRLKTLFSDDPTLQRGTVITPKYAAPFVPGQESEEDAAARRLNNARALANEYAKQQADAVKAQKELQQAFENARDSAEGYVQALTIQKDLMSGSRRERETFIDQLALEATGLEKGSQAWQDYAEQIRRVRALQDELHTSFQHGADVALTDYLDTVRDVSEASEDLFGNAMQGMEDSLVEFVKNGELSFSGLVDSIIADLIRLQVRNSITGPLAQGLFASLGAAGAGTVTATTPNYSINGFATGGSFVVGGSGGADSQYVGFMATPGERVTVTTPAQQRSGGGGTFYIDARGADAAAVGRIERVVRDINGTLERRAVAAVANEKARGGSFAGLMRN